VFRVYTPKRPVFAKIKKTGFEKPDFTPGAGNTDPLGESVRFRKILKISHSEKAANIRKIAFSGKTGRIGEKRFCTWGLDVGI
jgi:hypothetical protein